MFCTLLTHQWKAFYRSHYFSRSLMIKFLLGFTLLTLFIGLYRILLHLPAIIEQLRPEIDPLEFVFRQLIFIYVIDLAIRYKFQKVPRQAVKGYLHLPVSRAKLAKYTLIKSWFSIYNIYLLALLTPLLIKTVLVPISTEAFWFVITACFLLSMFNHAVIMYIKTMRRYGSSLTVWQIIVPLVFIGMIWLFHEHIQYWSSNFGMAMLTGNFGLYLIMGFAMVVFNILASRNLRTVMYEMTEQNHGKHAGEKMISENFFHRFPEYGMFWDIEWKLIMRNKRARTNFYQTPIIVLVLAYIFVSTDQQSIQAMVPILMMGMGSYGFTHLQYVFSWESRFFDFLASRNLDISMFIKAKYYFYVFLAGIQFMIISIGILIFKPDIFFLLLSIFLFVTGPGFCLLFYTGTGNSTRIDPNKTAFFNFEGTSGTLFVTMLLLFMSILPFYFIGFLLPTSTITGFSLSAGLTGLLFIIFNKLWISKISYNFLNNKYKLLSKYRET